MDLKYAWLLKSATDKTDSDGIMSYTVCIDVLNIFTLDVYRYYMKLQSSTLTFECFSAGAPCFLNFVQACFDRFYINKHVMDRIDSASFIELNDILDEHGVYVFDQCLNSILTMFLDYCNVDSLVKKQKQFEQKEQVKKKKRIIQSWRSFYFVKKTFNDLLHRTFNYATESFEKSVLCNEIVIYD